VRQLGLGLSAEAEQEAPPPAEELPWQKLSLKSIVHSYRYEDETADNIFTLGPMDMTIQAGSLVFVTGGNGSGKTTLAKIITGLYAPESGEVRWGDRRVTVETISQYRRLFSAVWSDGHVFDVLPEYEHPGQKATVDNYLRGLKLNRKVTVTGGKISTTELSQGQRKRLALLAAFLEDRPIYLFDEFAADQDPEFREVFYLQILDQLKARGKTVIVISHDDRYFSLADHFVRLDLGQIVETRIAGANGGTEPSRCVSAETQ
jgi:putative ATP-binding cassette transporter